MRQRVHCEEAAACALPKPLGHLLKQWRCGDAGFATVAFELEDDQGAPWHSIQRRL
jgi:hypothetical protein